MAGQMTIAFVKDMAQPLVLDQLATLFQQGDKNANVLRIEMMEGQKKADLSELSGGGQAERADGYRLPIEVNINGNVVSATIPEEAYNVAGPLVGFVRLTSGNGYVRRTILRFAAVVERQSDGPLLDSSNVIPSLDELLAKIDAMEKATSDGIAATNRANQAALNAEAAATGASSWANATASATQIAAGSTPTVNVTTLGNGNKQIKFGIPAGVTPNITFEVETGAPGSDVEMVQSGTPAAPHIKLTIPRGDTGAVDGVDYYTGNPAALGTASPGTANGVARGNHVHPMPYATQIPVSESENDKMVAAAIASIEESMDAFKEQQVEDGERIDALEAKFQTGTLSVTAEAGVVSKQTVTFPKAFASTPAVMVHLNTDASAVLDGGACAPTGISATGFTVNVFRKTAGNVPVRWMAFKP